MVFRADQTYRCRAGIRHYGWQSQCCVSASLEASKQDCLLFGLCQLKQVLSQETGHQAAIQTAGGLPAQADLAAEFQAATYWQNHSLPPQSPVLRLQLVAEIAFVPLHHW